MNALLAIWPTLGQGHAKFPRNVSWTKKGQGRRRAELDKKMTNVVDLLRNNGMKINPKDLVDIV